MMIDQWWWKNHVLSLFPLYLSHIYSLPSFLMHNFPIPSISPFYCPSSVPSFLPVLHIRLILSLFFFPFLWPLYTSSSSFHPSVVFSDPFFFLSLSIPPSFLSCCLSKDRKYFTFSLYSSNSALGLLWVWWEMTVCYMHVVVLFSSDSSTNFVQACVIRTSLNVIKIFWHTSNPVSTFVTTAIQWILDIVLILWNLNWRNNYIYIHHQHFHFTNKLLNLIMQKHLL